MLLQKSPKPNEITPLPSFTAPPLFNTDFQSLVWSEKKMQGSPLISTCSILNNIRTSWYIKETYLLLEHLITRTRRENLSRLIKDRNQTISSATQ